jgi:threonine dehydrogenase-like Zn-dependent dehydrogenase
MNVIKAKIYELLGPHELHLREEVINLNTIGDTEVVGKTIVSVVSPGTEIAAYTDAAPLRPMKVYPRLMGYCNIAEVVAIGKNVNSIKVGDRISTNQSHRSAFACDQSCVNAVLRDEDDATAQAALYLWHLGYYPLLRAGVTAGSNVAVIGLGLLGLTTVGVAKLAGCIVVAMSNREVALQQALDFGADSAISLKDLDAVNFLVEEQFPNVGIDLVISTSNSWDDWKVALEISRDGGAIAVVGFPGRGLPQASFNPLDSRYIYDKELTIYACGNPPAVNVSPRDIRFTLLHNYEYLGEMIRQGRLQAKSIITETTSWDQLDRIYTRMANREEGLITAALQWQDESRYV